MQGKEGANTLIFCPVMASATCFHQSCQIPFYCSYLIVPFLTPDKSQIKGKASGSSATWGMPSAKALGTQRPLQGVLSRPQTKHNSLYGVRTDLPAPFIHLTHRRKVTPWLSGRGQQPEHCGWWGPLLPEMETIPCDHGELWLCTFPGMQCDSYC